MQWIRAHLKIIIPVALVAGAGLAYLAFGVFAVQTLFIDDKVDEAGPVFASGAEAEPAPPATDDTSSVSDLPSENSTATTVPTSAAGGGGSSTPEIMTIAEGSFISRAHGGEGIARVLTDGTDQRFLRFEQFATDNGPDLNVYLTTADADAPDGDFDDSGEFVDLGDLKGNIGDQNYEIPADVDLDRFDTVVVWCVRFSVSFTTADLVPAA